MTCFVTKNKRFATRFGESKLAESNSTRIAVTVRVVTEVVKSYMISEIGVATIGSADSTTSRILIFAKGKEKTLNLIKKSIGLKEGD